MKRSDINGIERQGSCTCGCMHIGIRYTIKQWNDKMLQTRVEVDGEVVDRCSNEADHDELWR